MSGVKPLTENDNKLLCYAFQSLKNNAVLDIDYDKLAKAMGMTNPRSAANAMAQVKKKLAAITAASDGGDNTVETAEGSPGPSTPTPKKKQVKTAATPKRTPAAKRKAVKDEPDASDDENGVDPDVESPVVTKRKIAKPRAKKVKTEHAASDAEGNAAEPEAEPVKPVKPAKIPKKQAATKKNVKDEDPEEEEDVNMASDGDSDKETIIDDAPAKAAAAPAKKAAARKNTPAKKGTTAANTALTTAAALIDAAPSLDASDSEPRGRRIARSRGMTPINTDIIPTTNLPSLFNNPEASIFNSNKNVSDSERSERRSTRASTRRLTPSVASDAEGSQSGKVTKKKATKRTKGAKGAARKTAVKAGVDVQPTIDEGDEEAEA